MRALLIAATLCVASCGSDRDVCSPDDPCAEGDSCVIGRCRPASASVVSTETRRVVLLAKDVAVVSSKELPADARVTALGAGATGDVIVLMAFDADVTAAVKIEGAFLVVEPEAAAPGPSSQVVIDVVPVLSPWRADDVSWGRTPSVGQALGEARVTPAKRAALRVDVTELVSNRRGVGHGLALVASGADPIGARLVTMARSTDGPKLELYLSGPPLPPKPVEPSATVSASASAAPSASASAAPSASAKPK